MWVLQASVALWNHSWPRILQIFFPRMQSLSSAVPTPSCNANTAWHAKKLNHWTKPLNHCCNDPANQPPTYTTRVKTAGLIDVRHQDAVCNETRSIFTGGMLLHKYELETAWIDRAGSWPINNSKQQCLCAFRVAHGIHATSTLFAWMTQFEDSEDVPVQTQNSTNDLL